MAEEVDPPADDLFEAEPGGDAPDATDDYHDRMAELLMSHDWVPEQQPPQHHTKQPTPHHSHLRQRKTLGDVLDDIEYYNSAQMARASVSRLYQPKMPPGSHHRTFLQKGDSVRRSETTSRAKHASTRDTSAPPQSRGSRDRKLSSKEVADVCQRLYPDDPRAAAEYTKYLAERSQKHPPTAATYNMYSMRGKAVKDGPGGPWRRGAWRPVGPKEMHRFEEDCDREVLRPDSPPRQREAASPRGKLTEEQVAEVADRLSGNPFKKNMEQYLKEKLQEVPLSATTQTFYQTLSTKAKTLLPPEDDENAPGGPWRNAQWRRAGHSTMVESERRADRQLRLGLRPPTRSVSPRNTQSGESVTVMNTKSISAKRRERVSSPQTNSGRAWK